MHSFIHGMKPSTLSRLALILIPLVLVSSCGDSDNGTQPEKTGGIFVTSNPDGALILVDGKSTEGNTNATITGLTPGEHVVKVFMQDFESDPESLVVTVVADSTVDVEFTLTPTSSGGASIQVNANVGGAAISLDGIPTQETTPGTLTGLEPGTYRVTVRLEGFTVVPAEHVVVIDKDSTWVVHFQLNTTSPQSRKVFVEHFSNTACQPCKKPDLALESAVGRLGHDIVASIGVHLNWPSTSDPFFTSNSAQNLVRQTQQRVGPIPHFLLDGVVFGNPEDEDSLVARIEELSGIAPAFDVFVDIERSGNSIIISGSVYKRSETSGTDVLYAVAVETGINFNASNGLDHFDDICRRFLPGIEGEELDLDVGEGMAFRYVVSAGAQWVTSNIEAVAFVQSKETRAVYQGASTRE